jgi:hypothetical protein
MIFMEYKRLAESCIRLNIGNRDMDLEQGGNRIRFLLPEGSECLVVRCGIRKRCSDRNQAVEVQISKRLIELAVPADLVVAAYLASGADTKRDGIVSGRG